MHNSACLSESLGDKGLFRSVDILQIADAVHRVVFLLSLLCFWTIVRRKTSKMFPITHFQNNSKSSPGLLG